VCTSWYTGNIHTYHNCIVTIDLELKGLDECQLHGLFNDNSLQLQLLFAKHPDAVI